MDKQAKENPAPEDKQKLEDAATRELEKSEEPQPTSSLNFSDSVEQVGTDTVESADAAKARAAYAEKLRARRFRLARFEAYFENSFNNMIELDNLSVEKAVIARTKIENSFEKIRSRIF